MKQWALELDRLLRGDATRTSDLQQGTVRVQARGMLLTVLVLGALYGLCMGTYAVISPNGAGWQQLLAGMVKVPALFVLTLVVTFPSLYVFNALVGSQLSLLSVLRLIVAAMAVMLALLASFGTIVAFFSFTTESYPFMLLLNVAVFAVSGFLGLAFMLQTLHRLTVAQDLAAMQAAMEARESARRAAHPPESPATETDSLPLTTKAPGPLVPLPDLSPGRNVKNVFRIWIVVFAFVGAQMSWVLRPFIGSTTEFALFRPRGSNFFAAVLNAIQNLFGN